MILNKTRLFALLAGYVSVSSMESRIFNSNETPTIILRTIYHPSCHINSSNYGKVLSATSFVRMKYGSCTLSMGDIWVLSNNSIKIYVQHISTSQSLNQ